MYKLLKILAIFNNDMNAKRRAKAMSKLKCIGKAEPVQHSNATM